MNAFVMLLGLASTDVQPEPVAPQQYQIKVSVCDGDPLGSKAEGTVQVLAGPNLACLNGQSATFQCGGSHMPKTPDGRVYAVPFGLGLKFTTNAQKDGTIRLDCEVTYSKKNDTLGIQVGNTLVPGITSEVSTFVRVVKPGEKIRVRVAAESVAKQLWVELSAEPANPTAPEK